MMKKIKGVLLIFVGILQISFAQNVFPGFADDPSWQVANIGRTLAQTTTFEFERDTMICGELYSVILMWESNPVYVHSDSVKTIYKYEPDCNAPSYILYDYSLNEGASFENEYSGQFTVLEIDSVTLFEVNRKRLKVNTYFGEMYWIEGIGSTFHPFYAMMGLIADSPQNYLLLCYHEGEQQYYQTNQHNGCLLDYRIPDDYFYSFIYPNPFQDKTTLAIEMLEFREVYVELYTSLGQLVETYFSDSDTFHRIEIGEKLSSNGVYFLKIMIEDSIHTAQVLRWR